MKKWGLTAAGLMILAAAAYVLFEPSGAVLGRLRGESFFDGRPTGYWARSLCGDPATAVDAMERLREGQADSVPVLIELLEDTGPNSAELRWTAAELLGEIGVAAKPASGALLTALTDPDPHVRAVAAHSLPAIGVAADQAIPALTAMLETDQQMVAARVMSQYTADAKPALPDLIEVLTDTSLDSETRWNAARTIGKIGADAAEAIPVLVVCLEDEVDTVREHSAEALGDIGPPAGSAARALAAVLNDPATRVRRDAVRSLGQIGDEALVAVPEIKKLLDDPEEIVRDAAKNTLRTIAPAELPAEKEISGEPTSSVEATDRHSPAP